MTEHTKGRLAANYLGSIFGGAANGLIAQVIKTANPSICAADARRLVACWNACEGLHESQIDRLFKSDNEDYFTIKRERDELLDALRTSIESIRAWHGMGMLKHQEPEIWKIYWENSPEMRPLRDLLSKHAPKVEP